MIRSLSSIAISAPSQRGERVVRTFSNHKDDLNSAPMSLISKLFVGVKLRDSKGVMYNTGRLKGIRSRLGRISLRALDKNVVSLFYAPTKRLLQRLHRVAGIPLDSKFVSMEMILGKNAEVVGFILRFGTSWSSLGVADCVIRTDSRLNPTAISRFNLREFLARTGTHLEGVQERNPVPQPPKLIFGIDAQYSFSKLPLETVRRPLYDELRRDGDPPLWPPHAIAGSPSCGHNYIMPRFFSNGLMPDAPPLGDKELPSFREISEAFRLAMIEKGLTVLETAKEENPLAESFSPSSSEAPQGQPL